MGMNVFHFFTTRRRGVPEKQWRERILTLRGVNNLPQPPPRQIWHPDTRFSKLTLGSEARRGEAHTVRGAWWISLLACEPARCGVRGTPGVCSRAEMSWHFNLIAVSLSELSDMHVSSNFLDYKIQISSFWGVNYIKNEQSALPLDGSFPEGPLIHCSRPSLSR